MITSQNDTAPKLPYTKAHFWTGVITSQNDTAPKQRALSGILDPGVITSQNDTAPKLAGVQLHHPGV